MSTPSSVPDFKAGLKSFWQKPEGKTGIIVLLAGAGTFIGLYGLAVVRWMIAFATDLLHLGLLGLGMFAIGAVISNKTFRSIVSNSFQLVMRKATSILVEIDPIGVLENTKDRMAETLKKLSKAVGSCNGAKVGVERTMTRNQQIIDKAKGIAEQADKEINRTKDQLQQRRLQLNRSMQLQEIGRRMHSNEKLQAILNQTTTLYNMMVRWQQLGEFNVENTAAEIENAKSERAAIMEAYAGMSFARKLISGDSEQLKMMNASLEFLAQDNAMKLGEMEDFARYSERFLTSMDLEQGAAAADAEKMLAQYEQKLLSAGGVQSQVVPDMPIIDVQPEPILRSGTGGTKNQKYF